MRPALKPGLLPVWRDRDTLQIGIDSRRAVALTGMAGVASVIGLLDGSRDRAQVIRAAGDQGIPADVVDRVLALLAAAGALDDFPAGTLRVLSAPLRARLAAELATASLAHRDGDGGARTLARRLAAQVRVHGGGRVAGGISGLLTTAGVGRVLPDEEAAQAEPSTGTEPTTGADPVARTARVGKIAGAEEAGRARGKGRTSEAARAAGAAGPGTRPELAILVGRHSLDLRAALMREQIPHLAASADEAIGVVGPLVIPGRTACLRCLDLARADRDPAWPLILAQLDGRQPDPPACDAPLAAAVAAQAAAQALAFIDRDAPAGAVTDGTLELVLPGWQWRRRTWPRHNGCSCGSYTFR